MQVSSKQLRDDLMTMLIAGHETTAAVLTWTLHCLSQNPQFVPRLQAEVRPTYLIVKQVHDLTSSGSRLCSRAALSALQHTLCPIAAFAKFMAKHPVWTSPKSCIGMLLQHHSSLPHFTRSNAQCLVVLGAEASLSTRWTTLLATARPAWMSSSSCDSPPASSTRPCGCTPSPLCSSGKFPRMQKLMPIRYVLCELAR